MAIERLRLIHRSIKVNSEEQVSQPFVSQRVYGRLHDSHTDSHISWIQLGGLGPV